jgi:hypothetical protein
MALDPKTLKAIIGAHVTKAKKEHPIWDKWRAWYRSEFWGDQTNQDDPLLIENNYLYAFCDTMVASVCPPNPRITAVSKRSDEESKLATTYREALVNDILYRTEAHKLIWKMATHASVYPRAVLKAVYNFNLDRPDFIVLDPRYFFFDLSASRWEDIRYAIEVTTLTKDEFFSRTSKRTRKRSRRMQYDGAVAEKAKLGSFPKWLKDSEDTSASINEKIRDVFEWVTVYEVYDFTNDLYYHMLEDQEEPLFVGEMPYVFVRNPFVMLSFNENLADIGGMADSQLVERQQRRLNELDTLELRHAQSSIPVTVINEALCDNPEDFTDQVSTATSPGDVVRLQGKNAAPLADIIGSTPTSTLSPEFATIRDRIEGSIQFVLGIPEYARGVAGTSEVATELALVDSAMRTRLGRRTKLINSVVKHMAEATIGLYEEFLSSDTEIPVRTSGTKDVMTVARKHLSARSPDMAEKLKSIGEDPEKPLEIDYEVVPYSPTENSKSAQIKKLSQFFDVLLQNPSIDQRKLTAHLLDVLDVSADVLVSEEQLAAQQQAQQMQQPAPPQAPPGMALPTGQPQDVIATGGMPSGVPEVPVGAQGEMAGGAGMTTPSPGLM